MSTSKTELLEKLKHQEKLLHEQQRVLVEEIELEIEKRAALKKTAL